MGQLIIAISREYGSGGHEIAEKLGLKLNLPIYDRNMLEEIAKDKNVDHSELQKYDEAPKKKLLSRTVRGLSASNEANVANMQFDYLKEKARAGESFVVVGRCAETVLKGNDGLISFFIRGDMESKIERICSIRNMSVEEAKSTINRHDKTRKAYHNSFSDIKWGDSRNYDITINSSKIGIDAVLEILLSYIDKIAGLKK